MDYLIKQYNKSADRSEIRVVIDENGYMLQIYVSVLGEWFDDMRFSTQLDIEVWIEENTRK